MKIFLSLCCVMLAMMVHSIALNNESASSFRVINIHQREFGYSHFESMAITASEDLDAFLEETSQQGWNNRQQFVDALLNAKIDFNHEALVLLRHTEGSGSVRVSFETPVLQDKTLLCEIRGEVLRGVGTGDMAYHCFALAVSKSLVDKVQLTSVAGVGGGLQPTILLSTTERQPLKINRPTPPQKPSPGISAR